MRRSGGYCGLARRYFLLGVVCAGVFGMWRPVAVAQAQEAPTTGKEVTAESSLELRGELAAPRRLTAADLQRLPRAEVRTIDGRDGGKEALYAGVPLTEVLKAGGLALDPGMAGARETVPASLLVEAADGYRVVFALAEFDPALTDRVVLLADSKDGRPLRQEEGPWRLVVPGDKRPTRWVRHVTTLTVRRD